MKTRIVSIINSRWIAPAAVLIGALCLALPVRSGAQSLPASGCLFGKFLAEWDNIYWRRNLGALTLPTDHNGNAVVGPVALMPLPNTPGDGTPGSIDVTLDAGEPFFFPLFGLLGTSYTDGTPPDPFVDFSVFRTMKLRLTLDGKPILGIQEALETYARFSFTPPVPINSPPVKAVIWFEGMGTLFPPLPPGKHVLRIVEATTEPAFGALFAYDNTFHVTVKARR